MTAYDRWLDPPEEDEPKPEPDDPGEPNDFPED